MLCFLLVQHVINPESCNKNNRYWFNVRSESIWTDRLRIIYQLSILYLKKSYSILWGMHYLTNTMTKKITLCKTQHCEHTRCIFLWMFLAGAMLFWHPSLTLFGLCTCGSKLPQYIVTFLHDLYIFIGSYLW